MQSYTKNHKMTRLSVNINKFATLRNARGGNNPDLLKIARDCERFGAQGITVHPRPDERHITFNDVIELSDVVETEYNIEGYPDARFIDIIKRVQPAQATLVPDPPDVLTSNAGWDTLKNKSFLKDVIDELKVHTPRVSLFIQPDKKLIEGAVQVGAHRIELYTEPFASQFPKDPEKAVKFFASASRFGSEIGLGINAGHDLSLENLKFFKTNLPFLDEVSIGHALVCNALYFGLENTIQLYLRELMES